MNSTFSSPVGAQRAFAAVEEAKSIESEIEIDLTGLNAVWCATVERAFHLPIITTYHEPEPEHGEYIPPSVLRDFYSRLKRGVICDSEVYKPLYMTI